MAVKLIPPSPDGVATGFVLGSSAGGSIYKIVTLSLVSHLRKIKLKYDSIISGKQTGKEK
jgi:hypothetical protein